MTWLPSPGYDHFKVVDPENPPKPLHYIQWAKRTCHGVDVWLSTIYEPKRMGGPATHYFDRSEAQ